MAQWMVVVERQVDGTLHRREGEGLEPSGARLGEACEEHVGGLGLKQEWTPGTPAFNVTSGSQKLAYRRSENGGRLTLRGSEGMIVAMLV